MKFTLSLLAALLGVVSASSHNGSANGTATTPVSGGGGGGGGGGAGATTPAATTETLSNSTETTIFLTTDVTLTIDLPTDVNATDVYDVAVPTAGYKKHQTGCPSSPSAEVFVCTYVKVLSTAFESAGAVSSYLTGQVSAAARRSLTEITGRRLSGTAMKFPMKVFAETDAKLTDVDTLAKSESNLLAAVKAAADDMPGVTAPTAASATAPVLTQSGTTGSADTSSNAFEMGVSALAIVFSAFSLF